jgi:hypothetical protein
MSNTITFQNPGELDIRAVSTFGLSVKDGDNPIGFFGTGLKYAIAILLREQHDIEIWSGPDVYRFAVAADEFRGKPVDMITMTGPDGKTAPLPFTLELGKTWELWQAYRELYCNTDDEDGDVTHESRMVTDGTTTIIVTGDEFAEIHQRRSAFINTEDPILIGAKVQIVPTPGAYLKGVKVSSSIYHRTMFGYRFEEGLELTEDRTLASNWEAERMVRNTILEADDYDLIQKVLTADDGTFERQIDWTGGHGETVPPSPTFKAALADLVANRPNEIPEKAKSLARKFDDSAGVIKHEPTNAQQLAFVRAVEFLKLRGVNVEDYPVKFVKTLGNGILGQAKGGTIIIAADCFEYGAKMLAATLYEEHLHLSRGFEDMTRQMQNHLFHTIISLWEDAEGIAL